VTRRHPELTKIPESSNKSRTNNGSAESGYFQDDADVAGGSENGVAEHLTVPHVINTVKQQLVLFLLKLQEKHAVA
jgi:hypothetical protein